jgi:ATP-binding cassette, subfamily C (CFTR/MRP), member 1
VPSHITKEPTTNVIDAEKDRALLLQNASKLIEKEEAAIGSVGFAIYIRYFKNIGLWFGVMAIIFNTMMQGFSVYSNIWLSQWSESPDAGTDPAVRNLFLGVYGALGVGQALALFAGSLILAIGCLNAAKFLHNKLLNSSMKFPMSFFDTTPLGRIMNRFSKEVEMVDNTLPMTIRMWIMMLFSVLAVFVVITYSTPWFGVVIVPLAGIYYFIQKFYVATSRQLKRLESVTSSPIYSHFGESINGQSTIRAYQEEARFTNESEAKVDGNQMTSYPSIIANCWLGLRLELVGALVVLFAALFAVIGRENISPAIAGLSITYALQISQVLSFLVSLTAEVETNIVAIERMEEYAAFPQEAAWKKGEVVSTINSYIYSTQLPNKIYSHRIPLGQNMERFSFTTLNCVIGMAWIWY